MGTVLSLSPAASSGKGGGGGGLLADKAPGRVPGKGESRLKRPGVLISALTWKRLVAASAKKKKSTKKVTPKPGVSAPRGGAGVHRRAAALLGGLRVPPLLSPEGAEPRRTHLLVSQRGPLAAAAGLAGPGLHHPGQPGVRLPAVPGSAAGRRHREPGRAAGRLPHLPLSRLLLHGQRDLLPAQALPGGGRQGALLGALPGHHPAPQRQDAANQRGPALLHATLPGPQERGRGRRRVQALDDQPGPLGRYQAPGPGGGRGRAPRGGGGERLSDSPSCPHILLAFPLPQPSVPWRRCLDPPCSGSGCPPPPPATPAGGCAPEHRGGGEDRGGGVVSLPPSRRGGG
ncbi:cyclin-dependent kinase 5 activator 2 isoform X1 [Corvus hawaiiensis]|uniref:cyclin-dependent kinase 5 activator 2 isoform X1 n=1 Tax=Corvus hawaiiensis TaxID=134902 RepID=UPI00201922B5|nr:cyclin-dependent kinase 5 activator 2 isoform X1 [Corvus hawaiiensis]